MSISIQSLARQTALVVMSCLWALQTVACEPDRRSKVQTESSEPDPGIIAYEQGPWWKTPALTNQLLVNVDHLLISYAQAQLEYFFGFWHWHAERPKIARSEAEARSLITQVARSVRADPRLFARFARAHSDDVLSSASGGRMGIIRASNVPMEMVDAYSKLSPGEVSLPFQTISGFHLIRRLPDEAPRRLWARQIVVAYQGTRGWRRPDSDNRRSRDEARAIADKIAAELALDATRFAALVEKYSDDYSALVGGETGPRSTHDGAGNFATRQHLATMTVGAISPVIDEPDGFTVLQRLPDREPEWRAFEFVLIPAQDSYALPSRLRSNRSDAEARKLALEVAKEARRNPQAFADIQARFCDKGLCAAGARLASSGAFQPLIFRKLEAMADLQVADAPEWTPVGYMVYRKARVTEHDKTETTRAFVAQVAPVASR